MIRRAHNPSRIVTGVSALGLLACVALLGGCTAESTRPVPQKPEDQKAFATAELAAQSLVAAAKRGNMQELQAIFGAQGQEILSSGDPIADKHGREVFVTAFEQQWVLGTIDRQTKELVIGYERWPFPVPLVKGADGWWFDCAAGKDEVLARRVGRNELAAISACRTYVTAQQKYANEGHDGKLAGIFAQRVRSEPGKQNGLYWDPATAGGKASPLSDLAAQAEKDGYEKEAKAGPAPFYGYFFRILTQQGKDAPGGAKNYVVDGDMRDGFALIAYPAEYGNSGVMTLCVGQDGVVYETDLGEETVKLAAEIKEYNPDAKWHVVE